MWKLLPAPDFWPLALFWNKTEKHLYMKYKINVILTDMGLKYIQDIRLISMFRHMNVLIVQHPLWGIFPKPQKPLPWLFWLYQLPASSFLQALCITLFLFQPEIKDTFNNNILLFSVSLLLLHSFSKVTQPQQINNLDEQI